MTYKHILNDEREIKRNESNWFYESNLTHKKYLNRKRHSHYFYLEKYNNFSSLLQFVVQLFIFNTTNYFNS